MFCVIHHQVGKPGDKRKSNAPARGVTPKKGKEPEAAVWAERDTDDA
jgi:hypothetical protein